MTKREQKLRKINLIRAGILVSARHVFILISSSSELSADINIHVCLYVLHTLYYCFRGINQQHLHSSRQDKPTLSSAHVSCVCYYFIALWCHVGYRKSESSLLGCSQLSSTIVPFLWNIKLLVRFYIYIYKSVREICITSRIMDSVLDGAA